MTREEAEKKAYERYPEDFGPCDKPSIYDDTRTLRIQREAYIEGLLDGSSEIPNDLEEAASGYADKHGFRVPYDGSNNFYDDVDIKASKEGFIAGAKWDRSQIMKEAVEIGTTDICWEQDGDRAFPTFDPPVEDLLMPGIISQRFNDGDKVRIIIVKEN